MRVPRIAPRKTTEWTSEVGERARANNAESHTIRSIRTGRMRAATRRGALRAHHSWRPRLAESWVPVRVRWCGCRRQRSLGRFPEPSSRRSEETRQPRARRQRSSSAFVGSVRQPTGKTKLKMPLVSPSPRAPFLTPSLCPSRSYARSLARSQASLSGCHSVDLESHVSLGHSSRYLSLEDRFSATRSLKRRAIVAAKRNEDAIARPRDFRGESWGAAVFCG